MEKDTLQKLNDLMVTNELFFVKGQLRNLQKVNKEKDGKLTGEFYYLADLKVPRANESASVYSTSFNMYHICFSNDFITRNEEVSDEYMKQFKDNEVLVHLSPFANINKSKDGEGNPIKFNNTKFYVNDLMLVQNLDKPSFVPSKVVNL